MKIGLVCMRKGQSFKKGFTGLKALRQASENEKREKLFNASIFNLKQTYKNVQFCIDNNISSYRISSEIIPFYEYWNWEDEDEIIRLMYMINNLAKNLTLIIHPDQFTVINSPDPSVVANSIKILEHHYLLCQLMGIQHIILHTGGVYGDKDEAMIRFADNFISLPEALRNLIRLENCHSYTISEVLFIGELCGCDVCYDFHHERVIRKSIVLLCLHIYNLEKVIEHNSFETITHLSSGKKSECDRSHADFISSADLSILSIIEDYNVICEIEAKAKDEACIKLLK